MRNYEFSWDLIGDIGAGRPNLGSSVDIELYRLMQFTVRDVIEAKYGKEATDEIFFEAGKLAGKAFYSRYINPVSSLEEFVQKTQAALKNKNVGILRIEEVLLDQGKVVLTVDEDLDCSGLPEMDDEICVYDEGFVSALFEEFSSVQWVAKEIDCWCSGARTCRFSVEKK